MIKEGQKVRVFGVLNNSWVLGEILNIEAEHVTVLIKDWTGIKNGSLFKVSPSQVEEIFGRVE
jgi:hypothetical protein